MGSDSACHARLRSLVIPASQYIRQRGLRLALEPHVRSESSHQLMYCDAFGFSRTQRSLVWGLIHTRLYSETCLVPSHMCGLLAEKADFLSRKTPSRQVRLGHFLCLATKKGKVLDSRIKPTRADSSFSAIFYVHTPWYSTKCTKNSSFSVFYMKNRSLVELWRHFQVKLGVKERTSRGIVVMHTYNLKVSTELLKGSWQDFQAGIICRQFISTSWGVWKKSADGSRLPTHWEVKHPSLYFRLITQGILILRSWEDQNKDEMSSLR